MGTPIRKPARAMAGHSASVVKKTAVQAPGKPARPRGKAKDTFHLKIDDALKAEATKTLKAIGFTLSDAVLLFLHRVVVEKALPLRLDVPNLGVFAVAGDIPNAETRAAIEEARSTNVASFKTAEELFNALEKDGFR